MNEVEKFFSELPSEDKKPADIFDDKKPEGSEPPVSEKTDSEEEPHKNRRHRRWESKLEERERELIAREARVQALSEVERETNSRNSSEVPAEWIALYGNSPESEKAWQVQERFLADYANKAKEEAIREFEDRQMQEQDAQKGFESYIDSQLENLEDEHNIDLTSDAPKARKARREFLQLVQDLSPKDESGTITGYADFASTFEVYRKTATPERSENTINRQKELASRSIQGSGSGNYQVDNSDATERWLNKNGIRTRN